MFYSAPEVLKAGDISAKSDIWSLGVIIFHLLKFRLPTLQLSGKIELRQLQGIENELFR